MSFTECNSFTNVTNLGNLICVAMHYNLGMLLIYKLKSQKYINQ